MSSWNTPTRAKSQSAPVAAPVSKAVLPSSTILENSTNHTTVAAPIGLTAVAYSVASNATASNNYTAVTFTLWGEIVSDAVGVRAATDVSQVVITTSRNGVSSIFQNTATPLNVSSMEGMSKNYRRAPDLIPPLLSDELGLPSEQIDDTGAGLKDFRKSYTLPLVGLVGDNVQITSNMQGLAGAGTTPTSSRATWEITFHAKDRATCARNEFVQLVQTTTAAVLAAQTAVGAYPESVTQLSQPMYSSPRAFAYSIGCQLGTSITATWAESIRYVRWDPMSKGPERGNVPRFAIDAYRYNHGGEGPRPGFVGRTFAPRAHITNESIIIGNGPVASGIVASICVAYMCEA